MIGIVFHIYKKNI